MNIKHTPAPWITDTENDFIFSKGQSETHPNIICRLFDRNEENYPNSEANAKLIALSPIMFEYLVKKAHEGCKEAKNILSTLD